MTSVYLQLIKINESPACQSKVINQTVPQKDNNHFFRNLLGIEKEKQNPSVKQRYALIEIISSVCVYHAIFFCSQSVADYCVARCTCCCVDSFGSYSLYRLFQMLYSRHTACKLCSHKLDVHTHTNRHTDQRKKKSRLGFCLRKIYTKWLHNFTRYKLNCILII